MDRLELGHAVRRGAWWITGGQIASQLISFGSLAVLYRLVPPEEFGVFATLLVGVNLARLISSWGLGTASVQAQQLSDAEQARLFHQGYAVAAAVSLLFVVSCLVALQSSTTLWPVVICMGLAVFVAALGVQHQSRLERQMQMGRLGLCRLGAQLIGAATSIAAALSWPGALALAAGQLAEAVVLVVCLWLVEPWRPGWKWHRAEGSGGFFRFGTYYTLSGLMFWVAQNVDTLLIAALGGATAVGLYSQAFNLVMKPVLMVSTPTTALMLPALSRAMRDPATYAQMVVSFYRFVGILLLPCSVGLAVVGEDVMVLLGGEAWREAGLLLRLLAPVVAAQGLINITGSVFASAGRPDRLLAGATLMALLIAQAVVAGWWMGLSFGLPTTNTASRGTIGVAVAYSVVVVAIILLPYLAFAMHTVGVRVRDLAVALRRALAASALMGALVWWLHRGLAAASLPLPVGLGSTVLAGVLIYAAAMHRDLRALLRPGTAASTRNDA